MVEADVGDDAQIRTDDVGAIEAASQTYFNHGYIYLLFSEVVECHSGSQLEEQGMEGLEECPMVLHYLIVLL